MSLLWEYQDFMISKHKSAQHILYYTLLGFQLFYSSFLICTVTYVPEWMHTTSVVLFGTSFLTHSTMLLIYINPCRLAAMNLAIGMIAFISLLFVHGMWFWGMECVGFSSMLLFTPIEWYFTKDNTINGDITNSMISIEQNPL